MSPRDPPATGLSRGAWRAQRNRARQRGVEFQFTYEEWLLWWTEQLAKRGTHAMRGKLRGMWLMCRIGDQGPYAPGNVYCGSEADNHAEIPPEKRRHNKGYLKGKTGAAHPKSKAVGSFPSRAAAAKHYGISTTELRRRLVDGRLRPEYTLIGR